MTAELHQKTADICQAPEGQQHLTRRAWLRHPVPRSLARARPCCIPLAASSGLADGDIPLCPPSTAQGSQGSVPLSPELPATAARRLSTSVYWKGMVGLFCVFYRFFSSSLSLLCPRVTPDPPTPSFGVRAGENVLLPAPCAQMCRADGSAGRDGVWLPITVYNSY